jgi:hypothetical protein
MANVHKWTTDHSSAQAAMQPKLWRVLYNNDSLLGRKCDWISWTYLPWVVKQSWRMIKHFCIRQGRRLYKNISIGRSDSSSATAELHCFLPFSLRPAWACFRSRLAVPRPWRLLQRPSIYWYHAEMCLHFTFNECMVLYRRKVVHIYDVERGWSGASSNILHKMQKKLRSHDIQ